MDAKTLDAENKNGFDFPDILLPGLDGTRPIRRSIDLFRECAKQEEWDAFVAFQETAFKAEKRTRERRQSLEILVMTSEHTVSNSGTKLGVLVQDVQTPVKFPVEIRNTERALKVHATSYCHWTKWMTLPAGQGAPDWYKQLLRLHLELWALQAPNTDEIPAFPEVRSDDGKRRIHKYVAPRAVNTVRDAVRRACKSLYVECFTGAEVWGSHSNNAEERIANLQERIAKIDVPHVGWTDFEKEALSEIPAGTLAALLGSRLPPYTEKSCPSVSDTRTLRNTDKHTPVAKAVLEDLKTRYPDLAGRDVAAWPFQPIPITVEVKGVEQPVLVVFRSSRRGSKVPRLFHAFGSISLMAEVNGRATDDNHPAYLGELNWDGDRMILLDMNCKLYVRTWINSVKTDSAKREKKNDIPCTRKGRLFHATLLSDEVSLKLEQKFREEVKQEKRLEKEKKESMPVVDETDDIGDAEIEALLGESTEESTG
jgi:hypothetical protein